MITREKLDEAENLIRDLRMALDFKNAMDKDQPFMLLPLSDPVTTTFSEAKKTEVNTKIAELDTKLKAKLQELIKTK